MRIGRVEVSGGALLAAALLYYLDRSGISLLLLLSALLHELGHVGAILALGGKITLLRIGLGGAELRLSPLRPLSNGGMIWAALAGPGANLMVAFLCVSLAKSGLGERLFLLAGLNLGLALFNLLPVEWLDGGRALRYGLTALGQGKAGVILTRAASVFLSISLLIGGGILLWESEGRNFTLLLAGFWMVWNTFLPST